jgi:polyvinyl alcohol dehydrogenase (cytochrome)
MSREDIHTTLEKMRLKGVWAQGILIGKWARRRIYALALAGMFLLIGAAFLTPMLLGVRATSSEQFTSAGDWPTYGYDNARDNFNAAETIITPSTAPQLKQKWAHTGGNGISDEPTVVGGTVYWGSWDGYVHATSASTGAHVWSAFIGQTTASSCSPPRVGVASSPTVVSVNGQLDVFVGGGNANFYALNASTGSILWHTSLGASPSTFIWDSPAVFNGSVYIGTSSFGDCPLVQSKFFRLDPTNGSILNTFTIVPSGCTGAGVWGSPTIDESAGTIFIATGNSGSCNGGSEPYSFALVKLSASTLSVLDQFQLPAAERPGDSDFGSTPTLFTTSTGRLMVGVANKNGTYYAFDRNSFATGPVWKDQVANAGGCPQCGSGSISPSVWDGHNLYIGGGNTTISGSSCMGSVRKVDPDNGSFLWQHCMGAGPVLGSLTATASGVVAASQGNTVIVMNASTGATVARLHDSLTGSKLYGGPSISNGVLFVGNIDGNLYAYSPNGQ